LPSKTLSKYRAHRKKRSGTNFLTFYFERILYGKINAGFRCEPASFQVCCTPNSILWINPALSKANVCITLRFSNAIYRLALQKKYFLKVGGKCLKRELSNDV